MKRKSEVKFKIGDQVTIDCWRWACVAEIDEENQMIYAEDQDGEVLCVCFDRADLYN